MPLLRRSERHRDELGTRARQQAAIAAFGQRALAGVELRELLEEAAEVERASCAPTTSRCWS